MAEVLEGMKVSIGTFLKKKLGPLGVLSGEKIPFLPKTIARAVFMSDGESVEHAIRHHCNDISDINDDIKDLNNDMDKVKSGELGAGNAKAFKTLDEYKEALDKGVVRAEHICIVLEDATPSNATPDDDKASSDDQNS